MTRNIAISGFGYAKLPLAFVPHPKACAEPPVRGESRPVWVHRSKEDLICTRLIVVFKSWVKVA